MSSDVTKPNTALQPAPMRNPRTYYFAVLNAIISGVAIYVNSQGVKSLPGSTLYTPMKNASLASAC